MHLCINHNSCIDEAVHKAEMICQDKGLRFTELRQKILKMIWENHRPAKAYDILDKLKKGRYSAKPPTVYRTLDFLLEHGLVHKLASLNAYIGCSHPLKHNECYFLICRKCGEISECCNSKLAEAIIGITNRNKFRSKHITLEIEGECQGCIKKK